MWHFVSEEISKSLDIDFVCDDIRATGAGDSHQTFRISDGRKRFFVKTNLLSYLSHFEAEAEGLKHLQNAELFKVPNVIYSGVIEEKAFLVLEFLTLAEGEPQQWYQFGELLAKQHKDYTQNMYGWQEDNFIGLTSQPNQWQKKWSHFFAEQRIGFMLQLLSEQGHKLADIDKVVEAVNRLLSGHMPSASMLHGDLWSGNTGFHKGKPTLFDPAFYFGDRETDLALTELFNRFPNTFYQGYRDSWPLDAGYEYRKPIYQLYHLLNHAIMFGGHYLESAKSILNNMES